MGGYLEDPGILILRGLRLWENADRKEKRTCHANGDGTFVLDGEIKNKRDLMRGKIPEGCERFDVKEAGK